MPLQWLYEAGSDATYEDITDRVRLYTADFTQNAEEGAVALSRVTIDDPDGDYEIKGYRRIAAYETAASAGSNSLTYNGFIVDRTIIRGPYKTEAGRQWVCSVADTNVVAEFRLMVGSDANRPAETDVQRMQWLMSTSEMSRIPNTTFLNTSGPVAMDAVDYRGQRANDVLNDCAQASGKNHFTFAIDAAPAALPAAPGATHLWYDFADSTARTSSIRLSNINSDITGDPYGLTYAIADDTELERDPSRVYSGAIVNYDGGMVYEEDLSISNEFTRRDAVVPAQNVKTNAKATARALRYLAEMSTEEDRIRTAIRLPAARVNFVREGMRVRFRASHLPGYEAFTYQRVLRRTIKQDSEEEYLVTLELGTGPSSPTPAPSPAGEGSLYLGVDNILYGGLYINGIEMDLPEVTYTTRIAIPDGVLVNGSNVLAVGIDNGIEPTSWWGGNLTGLLVRVFVGPDDTGPIAGYTSTATKVWPIENLPSGTLGGEPAGWEDVGFDDSGWDTAANVGDDPDSGTFSLDMVYPPTAPSQWAGPIEAVGNNFSQTYVRGLSWLARIHFVI